MAVSKIKERSIYLGSIKSMLHSGNTTLLLATQKAIQKYDFSTETAEKFIDGKNIVDMTDVDSNHFAFVDQGMLLFSEIYKCEKATGKCVTYVGTSANCCGIAYMDNHFFLTYSTLGHISDGYVQIIDETGKVKKKIQKNNTDAPLFTGHLSGIHVTPDYDMFVADIGKASLSVFKIHVIYETATLQSEYEYMIVNNMTKCENKLILAIGEKKNEIVQITQLGPKRMIENKDLQGEPTAVCVIGKYLFVATRNIQRWFQKDEFFIEVFEMEQ